MLEYDLTQTAIFESVSREELPTEAEMFVLTVALLLARETSYTELAQTELHLTDDDIAALAECIEYRLSPLARDFGNPDQLRQWLKRFVGLRIAGDVMNVASPADQETIQNAFEQQG